MRDLSVLDAANFDLVWHAYSLNFVPDPRVVFGEVARVLRPGGRYHLMCANPLVLGLNPRAWNGQGYLLNRPFRDGEAIATEDEVWVHRGGPDVDATIPPPREYRHSLSTLVGGLVEHGLSISASQTCRASGPIRTPSPDLGPFRVDCTALAHVLVRARMSGRVQSRPADEQRANEQVDSVNSPASNSSAG